MFSRRARHVALRQMRCRLLCLFTILISLLDVGVGYLFRNRNYDSLEKEEYEAARAAKSSAKKAAAEAQACAAPQERPMATFKATRTGTITLPKTGKDTRLVRITCILHKCENCR
jgi:hypothetical protein